MTPELKSRSASSDGCPMTSRSAIVCVADLLRAPEPGPSSAYRDRLTRGLTPLRALGARRTRADRPTNLPREVLRPSSNCVADRTPAILLPGPTGWMQGRPEALSTWGATPGRNSKGTPCPDSSKPSPSRPRSPLSARLRRRLPRVGLPVAVVAVAPPAGPIFRCPDPRAPARWSLASPTATTSRLRTQARRTPPVRRSAISFRPARF
jgi:hypothetical protein